jgi:hypothetical protein
VLSAPAGYSGRALAAKLGVNAGMTVVAVEAPTQYRALLEPLPPGVRIVTRLSRRPKGLDFIHCFATARRMLATRFAALERALATDGALWISWPKGSSGVTTDLTENVVREIGLAHKLVDVKVCAVDDTWSALKFVRRLKDR